MYDVLDGVKVIEVASWTFVPVGGTVLADWGAQVIKVEHPTVGDPQRGLTSVLNLGNTINPMLELPNRGKRALAVDMSLPEGRELLYRLVRDADVFLTNYLPAIRTKLGIDVDDIVAQNPRIIYARGTGHGPKGPDAERGGFDMAASWARGGTAFAMTPPGGDPPSQPGSFGDLCGGLNLAGAVAAALFRRERTGKGAVVDMSLYSTGMWMMGQSVTAAPFGSRIPRYTRNETFNPLVNFYPTKDDRWLCLVLLQADRLWPDLARHLDLVHLIDDPRFADSPSRQANQIEFVAELDVAFRRKTLAEWRVDLADLEGVWSPVMSPEEIGQDPQTLANGYFPEVDAGDGESYRAVASPAQFDEQAVGRLVRSPHHGEHTEEILLELGYDWETIGGLKERNVIN
jgi:crotonobetainyl-CoA:carnitine CoA-transferase CaiB-like acyl-CoA transferase